MVLPFLILVTVHNAGHKGFADVAALTDGPLLGLGVAQLVQQERDHVGVEIIS